MEAMTHLERIRQRAYQIYLSRGRLPGREQEDWLQAEQEVMQGHEEQKAVSPDAFDLDGIDGRELTDHRPREHSRRHRHV